MTSEALPAQSGYTVPFTSGKFTTEDKSRQKIQKLNKTQKKQITQNAAKQN